MINKEFFFRGFKSIIKPDSPALALGCCFIAIGALLKKFRFQYSGKYFFNNVNLRFTRFIGNG